MRKYSKLILKRRKWEAKSVSILQGQFRLSGVCVWLGCTDSRESDGLGSWKETLSACFERSSLL